MGPGATRPGIGDPRARAPDSPSRPASTRAARGAAGHSGRENGQGPTSHQRTSKAPVPKRLGSHSRSPVPSPRPTPPLATQPADRPAGLLCANPNPRSAPEGPVPRGQALPHLDSWTPEPQLQIHPAALPPPGPLRAPTVIHGGRTCRALRALANFEAPRPKTLGPTLLFATAVTSASPSARCTAGRSGLPASFRLTLP